MSPAVWPRDNPLEERLLLIDPRDGSFRDARVGDLASMLRAPDLVVVNDAATMPASLHGTLADGAGAADGEAGPGKAVEARLVGELGDGRFTALLFGAGDWRTRTEDRPPAAAARAGSVLTFAPELTAEVESVSNESRRLVSIRFRQQGARLWSALYRHGRPIQYAYLAGPLPLWHAQTPYGSRPWAAELPSAGRPLAWGLLLELMRRGVGLATLTHAAGISSTGDAALDARLPLPERYDLPAETVRAVDEARRAGGRIVAIGTTVARALEGCAAQHRGRLVAGSGVTDLVLGPEHRPRVVTGLLTGVHDPGESHFRLLQAFAPRPLLARAHAHAEEAGYLCHEFGDASLILADAPPWQRAA